MIASKAFYQVTKDLKDHLLQNDVTNTVTYGDLSEVDLNKQTIFPLSHINVESVSLNGNYMTFSITVLNMDIVHDRIEAPETSTDDNRFNGTDNEMDVLNTQLWVSGNLTKHMERGDIRDEGYELASQPTCEPFSDRFANRLAGWAMSFDLNVTNDLSSC